MPRLPADFEAAGDNDALVDAVRHAGAVVETARGTELLAAVTWLIAALFVSNPVVRRAAADALARAFRRGDLEESARQLISSHRATLEAPHVDRMTVDSFYRRQPGGGRCHSDYPVHTDHGVGGSLE